MLIERKQRQYLKQDRELALSFFEVSRALTLAARYKDAAKRANVAERFVRLWVEGGWEGVVDAEPITVAIAGRPQPPAFLIDEDYEAPTFVPAHDLEQWFRENFIEDSGTLFNEHHTHLAAARIGILWTNIESRRGQRSISGTAEYIGGGGSMNWPTAQREFQLRGWFGEVPDFLITLDARYHAEADDATYCCSIEHEYYHCGQKRDRWGDLKFDRQTGNPVFGIRPHSVEEFWENTERWGVAASAAGVRELVEVAARKPLIAQATMRLACGTCM